MNVCIQVNHRKVVRGSKDNEACSSIEWLCSTSFRTFRGLLSLVPSSIFIIHIFDSAVFIIQESDVSMMKPIRMHSDIDWHASSIIPTLWRPLKDLQVISSNEAKRSNKFYLSALRIFLVQTYTLWYASKLYIFSAIRFILEIASMCTFLISWHSSIMHIIQVSNI